MSVPFNSTDKVKCSPLMPGTGALTLTLSCIDKMLDSERSSHSTTNVTKYQTLIYDNLFTTVPFLIFVPVSLHDLRSVILSYDIRLSPQQMIFHLRRSKLYSVHLA